MSTLSQKSFGAGELAPALYARTDQSKYTTGGRTVRNGIIMRHGGYTNRPGTKFVGEVKDSTKTVRLIPFEFNSDQTYVLEFGDQYMRVIRNGAQVTASSQNITAITNANPCVLTYSGADTYANGDEVYVSGVVGAMANYINGRNFKVANVNAGSNTFELNYMDGTAVNSTSWGAYTSGGTVAEIYTISTPYVEADLAELQYVQSADVITLAHPNYAPRQLSRSGHASWTLSTITFAPETAAPTGVTNSGAAGSTTEWVVTAVDSETSEESLASSSTGSSATPSSGSPITVSWSSVTGAGEYNVYKKKNGLYGLIGTAGSTSFIDTGITADTTDTPPTARNPFNATGDYPSVVTYLQQRLTFANTDNNPETVYTSRISQFKNFTRSQPTQDDDAVTFTMAGRKVNEVRHVIDLGMPIIFTTGGEWAAKGNDAGYLTPSDVNLKQHSYHGSSTLPPIIIGGTALFLQARGSIVRDLGFDYQVDGYRGNDLTIYSAHLFENHTFVDWTYQQTPHSILWMVRDDGKLVGLTYVREHQLVGWHRHDFEGTAENVCCVPEGDEDALYVVINRTIDGSTKRYIERFTQRRIDDIVDSVFMDCALTYDGRNSNLSHTMTLSGGTTWAYTEELTLTSSTSYFTSADVGNAIHLTGSDGTVIRFVISQYTSGTVVLGFAQMTVPVVMRSTAITDWAKAVDQVTGLWHLEGETVSVFGDGFVVASPNNEAYVTRTVTNGVLDLDKPYSVIHVGIPYISDLETLDIDTPNGETLADKKILINKVTVHLESSRGLWVGGTPPTDDSTDPLEGLTELKIRNDEPYADPVDLATDKVDIVIENSWNSNGRVFLRQVDPIPLTVLAVAPAGLIPMKG